MSFVMLLYGVDDENDEAQGSQEEEKAQKRTIINPGHREGG